MTQMTPHHAALEALSAAHPDCGLSFDVDAKYMGDWLIKAGPGDAPLALARPKTTEDVSALLACCNAHGIPVVPQGGLTGLAGGATPSSGALLISMERMSGLIALDAVSHTITVGAGMPLQRIQEAAEAAGLFFPLDIGSRGTCQIGGNLSTNAGGNRVLRYGMARDMVLGLEAVLADGTVVSAMNDMMKNNAAYDLKHMFIGSEGTLGIITRVVLKLFAKPQSVAVALVAFPDYLGLEKFLSLSRAQLGGALTAFEAMWNSFYKTAAVLTGKAPPMPTDYNVYALVEASSSDEDAQGLLSSLLETALAEDMIEDATLAQSVAQAQAIWGVRDMAGEVSLQYSPVGNFDVSVTTSRIDAFVKECSARMADRWQGLTTNWFGHVVDGNLHLMVGGFGAGELHEMEDVVYGTVRDFTGSISAEHGIGLQKRGHLAFSRTPAEIALMKQVKASLDPKGILNPGKIFL
jgi:FAD/FMN-containing dehydrogenase